jgi:predicted lactoylglutathione lyase
MANIYINLPVTNLEQSIEFYKAIWFTQNLQFTDQNASAMIYSENIMVMLLTHDFMKNYLPTWRTIADSHKTCEVLNSIQFDSKEEVDTFFDKAIVAWWKATIPTYDHGFMYGRDIEDLDGHIWEAFWMDLDQMPKE